jgi:hypothetical protein
MRNKLILGVWEEGVGSQDFCKASGGRVANQNCKDFILKILDYLKYPKLFKINDTERIYVLIRERFVLLI